MKLKYFLRGVGVGVIFGALIMLVAYLTTGAGKLTDKEIIERAENLGMVMEEDTVLIGTKEDTTSTTEAPTTKEDITTEAATTEAIIGDDVSLEGVVDGAIENSTTETSTEEATTEASTGDNTTEAKEGDKVTAKISVTSGMTSQEVALLLQDAGIIDDYADFDQFLNENGYSTQIRINDYEFSSGMSYEELAQALIKEDKQ